MNNQVLLIQLALRCIPSLNEVITGKEKEITVNNEVYVAQHVAPEYVNNDLVRIEIHKSVSNINTINDVEDLKMN